MQATYLGRAGLLLTALLFAGCGGEDKPTYDWRNRELAWRYGPTTGTATPEHLAGTGKLGQGAMAEGWKCELRGGTELTVRPFRLADEHRMFGKAGLVLALFDKSEQRITVLRTDQPVTKENATFTFTLDEATGKKVYDLILWYGKV
ncbi:MAG: hypothetical protein ACE37K_01450 [Planctomycetota bacterium]